MSNEKPSVLILMIVVAIAAGYVVGCSTAPQVTSAQSATATEASSDEFFIIVGKPEGMPSSDPTYLVVSSAGDATRVELAGGQKIYASNSLSVAIPGEININHGGTNKPVQIKSQ